MFSVTKTGLKTLPLWTLNVSPTKSGVIIDRRDQVLIGCLDLVSFAFTILSIRCPSTNGPFFIERPIGLVLFHGASIAAHQNKSVRMFSFDPGFFSLRDNAPGRHRMTAAGRLAGAATHGMINGILGHRPAQRTNAPV